MFRALFALVAAVFVSTASAQTGYVGAVAGLSGANVNCPPGLTGCRDRDTGFKVFGAYQVRPKIYAEVAYIGFGSVTASLDDRSELFKARAWTFGAAYRHPLPHDLTLVARAGLAMVTTRYERNYASRSSDSSWRVYGGLGLDYLLTDDIRLVTTLDATAGSTTNGEMLLYLAGFGVQGEF